jgi:diguanylate cyclase (GGDEF)-like protein
MLKSISSKMRNNIRIQDSLGRWGGEEFIIVLPDTGLRGGKETAEKLRMAVESESFLFRARIHKATLTFGVAQYDFRSDTIESFIRIADDGLLLGKREGKNRTKSVQ